MAVDVPVTLPPQSVFFLKADRKTHEKLQTFVIRSHGYIYEIDGVPRRWQASLRALVASAAEPQAVMEAIQQALGSAVPGDGWAAIKSFADGVVHIQFILKKDYGPWRTQPPETGPKDTAFKQPPQSPATMPVPQKKTASRAVLLRTRSHGYTYEVVGMPLLPSVQLQSILADATTPATAVALVNQAVQETGAALAGASAVMVGSDGVRITLLQQHVAQSNVVPGLQPFFQGMEGATLQSSDVLSQSALAGLYASRSGMQSQVHFEPLANPDEVKMVATEDPVQGAGPLGASLAIGNLGNRYAGRWLAQGGMTLHPGEGLEFTLNRTQSLPGNGSLTIDAAGASMVTPWGLYGINYSDTNYQVARSPAFLGYQPVQTTLNGNPAIAFIPLNGQQQEHGIIRTLSLTGERYLHMESTRNLSVIGGFSHVGNTAYNSVYYNTGTYLDTLPVRSEFYDSFSAELKGVTRFAPGGRAAALSGNLGLVKGLGAAGGPISASNGRTADMGFLSWQGNLNYEQALQADFKWFTSLSGQWSERAVPFTQQYALGGLGNLSAWLPGVSMGDRGALLRMVLASPTTSFDNSGKLGFSAFYEAGASTYLVGANSQGVNAFLSDVGIGANFTLRNAQLVLGCAEPVAASGVNPVLLNSMRSYLSVNLSANW
ncbi:ShlB/FhaC/HecB family hemolysin secretion/activation protein [Acidithiobacillus ferriphilus]|jgi:hypothetical protein|uniref:ShlB/FhaC/HecB family hemolysin secretion/activation protein n=1 Tax=Acidithiobacillus ferriphilus TaxID=1689834 RepID=UPI002430CDE8|nr:ShlB/FhaC/HecB family hemolysin secretion/activation protein [Acidithiobacillus ferriphilus]MBW9255504.1 hypothetical protein [Acidithiobacillus ferriphilus]